MSRHEIEDVLSSIRRLVSEELRPSARVAKAVEDEANMADARQPDKLLLTPALRVVATTYTASETVSVATLSDDTASAAAAAGGAGESRPVGRAATAEPEAFAEDGDEVFESDYIDAIPDGPRQAASPVEDVVAKFGATVGEGDQEWESPVGDVEGWADAGWTGSGAGAPMEDAPAAEPAPVFVRSGRLTLGATASDPVPEPDFIGAPAAAYEPFDEFDDDPGPPPPEAEEPVQAATWRTVTPPPSEDAAPDEGTWADAAEAAVMADLADDIQQDVAEAGLFEDGDPGMVFDEEVLRDLVRDIIREELAGTLGERITRNVRKLVRAEIARALAVREFE